MAAQGFADPRPAGTLTRRHLAKTLARTRLLQLDSVNVAVRAHYMPLFSRLGAYDPALVDDAAWKHAPRRPRLLVEYWAHEASLLPVEDWPLLLSGAKRAGWWRNYRALAEREPGLVDDVLAAVKELGPVGAGALETVLGGPGRPRPPGVSWWQRSDVKRICEWLFGMGALTTGTRVNFQRLYDLPERVLPPEVLAAHPADPDEAARGLIARAASALGIATEPDLRDYYRLAPDRSRQAVAELVEAGELEPVAVRGWRHRAYRHPAARTPRRIGARALLCPFDPLIWERARTERIFDFRYRIEIYVPEPRREYGYYVFPFLLDDALVARVDLKADRAAGVLRVPGAFAEPGADTSRVVAELAAELRLMAGWLGLDGVVAGERGDLAAPLAAALG
nr:crosslink repair DNA glycosylase YcaQ family protein [Pseudonocardia acidicola]